MTGFVMSREGQNFDNPRLQSGVATARTAHTRPNGAAHITALCVRNMVLLRPVGAKIFFEGCTPD